jgi:EmrB/QacA subfamily drug resistance transporter
LDDVEENSQAMHKMIHDSYFCVMRKKIKLPAEARVALWVSVLGSFLTPFMSAAINLALPLIGEDLHMKAIGLSWVASSYLLAAAIALLPMGRLADLLGRKKIYLLGISIYTLTSFFCAIASSAEMLILFRLLQGFGGAMMFSTATAILISVFPKERRGWALGIVVGSVYTALSLGPVLGGLLTEYFGWRSVFYINIPIGLLVIYLVIAKLKGEWAEAKGEAFDWWGSLIYSLALFAFMFGLSKMPAVTGISFFALGLMLMLLFVLYERKQTFPLLKLTLFTRNRVFAFSNLAALINYSATFAIGFMLSLYLQFVKGLRPRDAGLLLVAQPVMMAVFSPLAGRLSDRTDARWLASFGMGVIVVGLILLSFLHENSSNTSIILILLLLGFGFGVFSSPNTNAVMSSVEKKYLGIASASLSTMRMIGQMVSMGGAMVVINIFIGQSKIVLHNYPDFMLAMRLLFIAFSVLCVLGVFASLARGRKSIT